MILTLVIIGVFYTLGGLLTCLVFLQMPIVIDGRAWIALLVIFLCWPLVLPSILFGGR